MDVSLPFASHQGPNSTGFPKGEASESRSSSTTDEFSQERDNTDHYDEAPCFTRVQGAQISIQSGKREVLEPTVSYYISMG